MRFLENAKNKKNPITKFCVEVDMSLILMFHLLVCSFKQTLIIYLSRVQIPAMMTTSIQETCPK